MGRGAALRLADAEPARGEGALRAPGQLLEADVDVDDLDEAAEAYAEQVSEAVAADSETAAYVEELERRADEVDEEQEIPSGDTLAAELTRYLQEHEARKREEEDEQPE